MNALSLTSDEQALLGEAIATGWYPADGKRIALLRAFCWTCKHAGRAAVFTTGGKVCVEGAAIQAVQAIVCDAKARQTRGRVEVRCSDPEALAAKVSEGLNTSGMVPR